MRVDLIQFGSTILIVVLGLTVLRSVSPELFPQQLAFAFIGLVAYFITAKINYKIYSGFSWISYVYSLLFLGATFLLGTTSRGSLRWIVVGPIFLQASELIRPAIVVFFAVMLSRFPRPLKVANLLVVISLFAPIALLIHFQPDLGSLLVISASIFGLVLAAGVRLKHLLLAGVLILILSPIVIVNLKPYQKDRLLSFINPYTDPLGKGYNSIQSVIAVGSGQFWGRGLGRGTQSHLRFLPENHTDFIFASLAEELGLVGSLLLLSAYLVLFLRIYAVANSADDRAGTLISAGALALLSFQTIVNISMNIGLAPITGVTLPLVSYGGSSFLSTAVLLGIVQNIASQTKVRPISLTIR